MSSYAMLKRVLDRDAVFGGHLPEVAPPPNVLLVDWLDFGKSKLFERAINQVRKRGLAFREINGSLNGLAYFFFLSVHPPYIQPGLFSVNNLGCL